MHSAADTSTNFSSSVASVVTKIWHKISIIEKATKVPRKREKFANYWKNNFRLWTTYPKKIFSHCFSEANLIIAPNHLLYPYEQFKDIKSDRGHSLTIFISQSFYFTYMVITPKPCGRLYSNKLQIVWI